MRTVEELVDGLRSGDRRAIARLISLVEDGAPEASAVLREVYPLTGHASTVGITGAPGAGKSSLIDGLVHRMRSADLAVGVIAIDPTSPFSGGALLGDRVRMQTHSLDEKVFIRSMATRGHLGGLSLAAPEAMRVLEAAGSDVVIVETVGVGQSEVEVAKQADTTIVVLAPGMGDAIQAAKAGILEIADVFCVNKGDRQGASRTVAELRELRTLGDTGRAGAPIVVTTASSGEGVEDLAAAVDEHRNALVARDGLAQRRTARARLQIREVALGTVRDRAAQLTGAAGLNDLAAAVARRELDPYTAAGRLLHTMALT